jgi:magnesium and cobalt exporter, CNNM family
MIADAIITLIIGKQRARGSLVTEDILRTLAHEAVQEGVVDHREARFIDQLFDFSHKSVAEVMIPRSAIFYLPVEMPLSEIVAELIRTRFTRVPIFKGNRDNVVGILYARDLLRVDYQTAILEGQTVEGFLREPFLVPAVKPAAELFETFRERNLTIALTVDEFGGITGLVTVEDLGTVRGGPGYTYKILYPTRAVYGGHRQYFASVTGVEKVR